MPGAPNRPPEKTPEAPLPAPVPEPPEKKALRRIVPTRVTLLLDLWKGTPSPELTGPFERAESAYASGDYAAALTALDLLSVRFAEPRWPTIPEPFRLLRVPISAPVPPHWDPENALTAPEKEAKKTRRTADDQLALLRGCLSWAGSHGVDVSDLAPHADGAASAISDPAGLAAFYEHVDATWTALHTRVPAPKSTAARPAPPPTAEAEGA